MESISIIKEKFKDRTEEELRSLIKEYASDERAGVAAIRERAEKSLEALKAERERMKHLFSYERQYPDAKYICGIDEVGRGPFAGPVVACAVILPKEEECDILYLNDSKQVRAKMREKLSEEIKEKAVAYGIGIVDNRRIDEINILQATFEAMREAIKNLSVTPDILLNDAVTIPGVDIPQVPIEKGDTKSASIAAASIVAKVYRDALMAEYDKTYPGYGFAQNAGYGTEAHRKALKEIGPCELHRRTFIHDYV